MKLKIKIFSAVAIFFINFSIYSSLSNLSLFNNSRSSNCFSGCNSGSCADTKSVPCAIRNLPCCTQACTIFCNTGCYNCGTTTYIPRSTGDNIFREMVGWDKSIYKYSIDQNYTSAALAIEYTRSFNSTRIANSLFCTNCLTFAGSFVPNRINGTDIIADNFGLSPFFTGAVKINPRIENYIFDINLFFGVEEWLPGLFFRVHAPITHTRWNLNLNECIRCDSLITTTVCELLVTTSTFPCPTPICASASSVAPLSSSIIYPNIRTVLGGDFLFGDMRTPWNYGRFSFCPQDLTRLADLDILFGFNFASFYWFNTAIYLKAVVPTGSHITSRYIFEPVVGNGRHPEFGIGFSTHINLLGDPCNSYHTFGLYIEGNITHMFKAHQVRSFDFLRNGLLSRYLLLKEFASDGITYTGNLINAINYTTRNCYVKIDTKGELAIKLSYRNDSWNFDIGYDVYGRSAEKICIVNNCPCDLERRRFGIKGNTGVCAREFSVINNTLGSLIATVPLNSTESSATLFSPAPIDNPTVIAPTLAGDIVITNASPEEFGTPLNLVTVAQSSHPPVLVKCCDLDPNSAAQCSILTHKLFTFINYIWFDTCWEPYLGVGSEIEIAQKGPQALSQWGILVKAGLNF